MNQTAFSIVIPTYERNEALAACLERLKPGGQKIAFNRYEVIVTDDGQHQNAEQMVANRFPWVRWIKGPCRGPAANRNNGAKAASGEWLVFTDDDCLPESGWLKAFHHVSCENTPLLEGRTICKEGLPSILYESPINETGGRLWSCNFAIQRSLFFKIGGFDERFPYAFSEDDEFSSRLKQHGIRSQFVKDAVVDHPPRRRPFGKAWQKRWQSQILKEKIMGKVVCGDRLMPLRVAYNRLKESCSAESISIWACLIHSAAIESYFVARNYRQWMRWADAEKAKGWELDDVAAVPSKS
ncbi:Glycosyl transferase, family 2 domain protein [Rhodopirellula maiorica SM1]|uniref:Glycosyl transferase, family 2 domain protein n=1 Tax=Rhodopirellula maiorica SM1 TaxID=1265738 RepID=M5RJM7_9BACT|nr:glycosyltransferase [Rhodopirellula maiorica]EMI15582.1 Glycosyl transferase, family 2 domain protein [Rhodopirellula maiorica SM1]